jgi:DNA-binding GntR family transcriptional regulator
MARATELRDIRRGALDRRNVSRDVAAHIRKVILDGTLRPNEKIPQDDIAAELGVSRIPVREALLTLASEGFVVLEPYRGAFVSPLERGDIEDQYDLYGLIHGLAATRAAEVLDEETLARLEEINNRFRASANFDQLDPLDWEFHRTINLAGGSRRLHTILRTVAALSRNVPRNFFLEVPNAKQASVSAHEKIIQALRDRNGQKASDACYQHIRDQGDQVLRVMERNGFWADLNATGT